jgi:2-methylisocitrate lyase-like PEP mutase family enzyme
MTLKDLGALGYKIVADPSTPLWAAYAAWKKIYAELADDFGARAERADWTAIERDVLQVIGIDTLLAVERATVEKGKA